MNAQKLRIVILGINYAPEPTGIAPYTTKLAEALVAGGHEVQVVTGYPHYPKWKLAEGYSGWRRFEVINGVRIHRVRHFIPGRVTALQRMLLELSFGIRLMFSRWDNPDVIVAVSPALFSTALVLLRSRLGKRKVGTGLWVQDLYSRGVEETSAGGTAAIQMIKKVEGVVLRSADKVAVIHDRFKDYVVDELGVSPSRVTVIRNWTHVAQPAMVDRAAVRKKHGWRDDDIVVLHAGNMGVKQGLINVVEAARLSDQRNSKVRFVLLGDGNQRRLIENLARGVQQIDFIAPLPDAEFMEAMGAADILLVNELPGLREMAVPSKLTSYFSTGIPILAATEADSTTAAEIELSQAGIRVDPGSPLKILQAAEKLYDSPSRASQLGIAGKNYVHDNLSESAAVLRYSRWLYELAESGKTSRSVPAKN